MAGQIARSQPRSGPPLVIAAVALSILGGCGPGGPLTVRLHPETRRPERGVVLFICDGLHRGMMEQGCREGWLPNIQKRLVERGVRVEHAVCEMPSITYANMTTFATGLVPGNHEILGNSWFDPELQLFRDYSLIRTYRVVNEDFSQPTIYEWLKPAPTASIQSPIKRGLTQNFANWAVSGVMWYFGDYTAVDKLTATTIDRVAAWANGRREWPTLLTCYFPGVDTVGHRLGPDSPRYRWAVEHFDFQFGRVVDWLERESLLANTAIILVSDHGLVNCQPGGRIDLHAYARDVLGRKVAAEMLQEDAARDRRAYYDGFDTVIADKGVRFASIHLRGAAGWDGPRPAPADIAALLERPAVGQRLWDLPGIDLVAYRESAHSFVLRAASGTARIHVQRAPGAAPAEAATDVVYGYQPAPEDILGYRADPELAAFVDAGYHAARDWLTAGRASEFPAVVPQLPHLFRTAVAGQVVVFAAPGYSFDDEAGGHGGIRRDEVCIPLLFAGPGLPAGTTLPMARAADLAPTILALAGQPPQPGTFDGIALFDVSRVVHPPAEPVKPQ